MAALVALDAGCTVFLLGAEVPAADLVTAARRGGLDVVALAASYGGNRAAAVAETAQPRPPPAGVHRAVGGRPATAPPSADALGSRARSCSTASTRSRARSIACARRRRGIGSQ